MPCSPSARRLNKELQTIIDEQTEPWGIKVSTVEVKDVELPQDMQRAIALQAQAERERRAKIIGAEGEFQAAQKLADAADIMSQNPATIQLRYLQTLLQIGVNNTTIVFPLPIELMDAFQRITGGEGKTIVPARAGPRPTPPAAGPDPSRSHPDRGFPDSAGGRGSPEIRIDQLTGLRSLLAPGSPRSPPRLRVACRRAGGRRRRDLSLLRGPRGSHPARGLGEPARRRSRPTARAGCSDRSPTSTRC